MKRDRVRHDINNRVMHTNKKKLNPTWMNKWNE